MLYLEQVYPASVWQQHAGIFPQISLCRVDQKSLPAANFIFCLSLHFRPWARSRVRRDPVVLQLGPEDRIQDLREALQAEQQWVQEVPRGGHRHPERQGKLLQAVGPHGTGKIMINDPRLYCGWHGWYIMWNRMYPKTDNRSYVSLQRQHIKNVTRPLVPGVPRVIHRETHLIDFQKAANMKNPVYFAVVRYVV